MCYNTLVLQTAHGELQDKLTMIIKKILYFGGQTNGKEVLLSLLRG